MEFRLPPPATLVTESDVEQKLVYPFLVCEAPFGLEIPIENVLTKINIRKLEIGKGRELKLYYPDYLIVVDGYPLGLVEVKKPGENLVEALREARQYAVEINACYPTGVNPLTNLLATDGKKILYGDWDDAGDVKEMNVASLIPETHAFSELSSRFAFAEFKNLAVKLLAKQKIKSGNKPRRMIGGKALQNEEVGHNTFGAKISAELGHIFNPNSYGDREFIVRNGYIHSNRRDKYIDPIDKVIRAALPTSSTDAALITDTKKPVDLLKKLRSGKVLEHKVLLIIGGVGSGKTTFIDHLRHVALPSDLKQSTLWLRIDMNEAPVSANEIYSWLRQQIVISCQLAFPEIDFESLNTLRALFSVEINKFNKGVGGLYGIGTDQYNVKLADLLTTLSKDEHQTAVSYTRYCGTERNKLVIIVLDNCDKRTLSEQLLMFEAAQWIRKEFRALVMLPLREETYENHRDQPPLDTALKDAVFRIEPPLFQQVLVRRTQLALDHMMGTSNGNLRYELPNGFAVNYSRNDLSFYLTSIIKSIFDHDKHIRRMIVGLSGRNIRRAMEIFLEFCTSGHIGEDEIFKIRQAEGQYSLPLHLVTRVLLRTNRRYYDSDYSYLKNLYSATKFDQRANYFTRMMILRWLHSNFNQPGKNGLKGYFSVQHLKNNLTVYGLDANVMQREIEYLLKGFCLVSEDFKISGVSNEDLICLAPAGFVHLDMLGNINYLAAISEDTLFTDEDAARRVAERIGILERQYNGVTMYENAKEVVNFLESERKKFSETAKVFLSSNDFDLLTDMKPSQEAIADFYKSGADAHWIKGAEKYLIRSEHDGRIVNRNSHGLFVEVEPGITGLLYANLLPASYLRDSIYEPGEPLRVSINRYDAFSKRLSLRLCSV